MKHLFILLIAMAGLKASAQTKIAAKEAAKHLNENVSICDKIYSTKLIENTGMVLLDMGDAHPDQYLTVVIKGEDKSKFNAKPEEYYKGKDVCVTGKLIDYKGKPEIIVTSPDDLKLQ
jgi:DNA/RNA endonuclease YhcR with UshA esterase domain